MRKLMSDQYSFFDDDPPRRQSEARNDVRKGDAAEALVLFKLLNWGWDAHDARRDLPYQPVDEVLVQSERRSKRMFTTIRAGMALWATRTMMRASYAPLLVGSRTRKHQPRATASFGVPAPISRRISSPRLCPATWIR